jgi:hypothetical protein
MESFIILTLYLAGLSLSSRGKPEKKTLRRFCRKLEKNYNTYLKEIRPIPVAARSEAKALIVWTLRSRVRIPLNVFLVFLCCAVLWT